MTKKSNKSRQVKQESSKANGSNSEVSKNAEVKAESRPAYRVEKIGTVAIDTGHIVIVDPCRVDEVQNRFDGPLDLTGQLGQFVVGSQTGLGDGRYPVFAEIISDDMCGERVAALHLHFDPIYCFADDPNCAEQIKQQEAEFLASMNKA